MIKLKDILNEIAFNYPKTVRWVSPPGTPDEVINVVHRILETIVRNKPEGRPTKAYWRVVVPQNGVWVIQNAFNPEVIMFYLQEKNQWWAPDNIGKGPTWTPLSQNGLDLMIKNWMI